MANNNPDLRVFELFTILGFVRLRLLEGMLRRTRQEIGHVLLAGVGRATRFSTGCIAHRTSARSCSPLSVPLNNILNTPEAVLAVAARAR
jgi:hypothetical protein